MLLVQQILVLQILAKSGEWMYGLEIVKASDRKLKRGTVHTFLRDLEAHGYVESREEMPEERGRPLTEGYPPPRKYRITAGGQHQLADLEATAGHLCPT